MNKEPSLKARLNLFDATAINIGAIIGGGIFVVTGIAAGVAGSAFIISVLIAGVITVFTAISVSRLAAKMPREGGIYEYAYNMISPFTGFLTGWMWVVSNVFAGATVALGFGHYLAGVMPQVPAQISAVVFCLALTALNYYGVRSSSMVNNGMVIAKLLALAVFVVVAAAHIKTAKLVPFHPFSTGVVQGAFFIFFAFGGFARVAVLGEEIKDPVKNIPRAIFLSLLISSVVYILVGFLAVAVAGASVLGKSDSPLAEAMKIAGNITASNIVIAGALIATATVLLTTVLGVSRVIYAMTNEGFFPRFLGRLNEKHNTPSISIWLTGAAIALLVSVADLASVVAISVFANLFYYIAANISAFRLKTETGTVFKTVTVLGAVSCLGLLVFTSIQSPATLVAGAASMLAGIIYYYLRVITRKEKIA